MKTTTISSQEVNKINSEQDLRDLVKNKLDNAKEDQYLSKVYKILNNRLKQRKIKPIGYTAFIGLVINHIAEND